MNTSLPISALRLAGLVERQATVAGGKAVAVASITAVPVRRTGALQRFLKALTRSLSALSA